jgi:hypothetical protein
LSVDPWLFECSVGKRKQASKIDDTGGASNEYTKATGNYLIAKIAWKVDIFWVRSSNVFAWIFLLSVASSEGKNLVENSA